MAELRFSRNQAVTLAVEVWRGFLGLEIRPVEAALAGGLKGPVISAGITVKGEWSGGVFVHCPLSVAELAATRALGIAKPSYEDVSDVIGEVANILSGRLLHYMADGTEISLPVVAAGDDFQVTIPGSRPGYELGFVLDGVPLVILIVSADPASVEAHLQQNPRD